jgi:hypothetical protein
MNASQVQTLIVAAVALLFGLVIVFLARSQKISFRYTVGWLCLAGIALGAGFLIPLVNPIAGWLKLSAVSVLVGLSVSILLAVCIQLSISICGLQRHLKIVIEELGIIRALHESE